MSLSNAGKTKLAIALLPCMFVSGCGNDPASNSHPLVTDAAPIPQKTLSTATSPPAGVIEALRTEMREAAPAPAREGTPLQASLVNAARRPPFPITTRKETTPNTLGFTAAR